ncbi:aminotransferase, class V family protein, partial [Cardiosporidium cionae]
MLRYGLSKECQWSVLLDAAAYVTTAALNLTESPADFITISFYKIFGYPTGLGALLLRRSSKSRLRKIYFGGGTVISASCDNLWCAYKDDPSARFEDGTLSFLAIAAIRHGYEAFEAIDIRTIRANVESLTRYLAAEMDAMRHYNDRAVVLRYGASPTDPLPAGGIITFNLKRPNGNFFNFAT